MVDAVVRTLAQMREYTSMMTVIHVEKEKKEILIPEEKKSVTETEIPDGHLI